MHAWAPFHTSRKADQLTGAGDPYRQQQHSIQELVWSLLLCPPLPTHPWIFFYGKKTLKDPLILTIQFLSASKDLVSRNTREQIESLCEMDRQSGDTEFSLAFAMK